MHQEKLDKILASDPIITYDPALLDHMVGTQKSWAFTEEWPGVPSVERNGVTYWFHKRTDSNSRKIRKWHEEGNKGGVTTHLPPEDTFSELEVPDVGMIGLGRDFADLYASHMEAPRGYFYFAWLTFLGFLVAKQVRLDSSLDTEPRLYTVLLGETATSRKSTVIEKTTKFFEPFTRGQEERGCKKPWDISTGPSTTPLLETEEDSE